MIDNPSKIVELKNRKEDVSARLLVVAYYLIMASVVN